MFLRPSVVYRIHIADRGSCLRQLPIFTIPSFFKKKQQRRFPSEVCCQISNVVIDINKEQKNGSTFGFAARLIFRQVFESISREPTIESHSKLHVRVLSFHEIYVLISF